VLRQWGDPDKIRIDGEGRILPRGDDESRDEMDEVTVPRIMLGVGAVVVAVGGEVLTGLCLLGALGCYVVWRHQSAQQDRPR
jgi:hypothetical protein